jgi:hypothetical protein
MAAVAYPSEQSKLDYICWLPPAIRLPICILSSGALVRFYGPAWHNTWALGRHAIT